MRSGPITLSLLALAGCGGPAAAPDAGAMPDGAPVDLSAAVPPRDLAPPRDLTQPTGPMRLSETGLYSDIASRTLAPGVIEYEPRYPLWSDGAEKRRFLLLPPGTKIDTSDMDNWRFPIGTKVWKQFKRDGKTIETRLLQKEWDADDGWFEIAYAWDDLEQDAYAAPDGLDAVRGTQHWIPSQKDCDRCHSGVVDVIIGVSAIQLSAPAGAAPDGGSALSRLAQADLLSNPPKGDFEPPGQGIVKDALGYMHGNCGHCHSDEAPLAIKVHLRLRLLTANKTPDDTGAYLTAIDSRAAHMLPNGVKINVVPGQPDQSQLWLRMGMRDDWAMPPACTRVPDPTGMQVVHDWIAQLPPSP